MAMLHGNAEAQGYQAALAQMTKADWVVVSEGPSGAQLKAPKKMRALDKAALVIGVLAAFANVFVGGFFILIAVIDYAFLTKEKTAFLSRDNPVLPQ